jgi:hypothetical protein
MDMEEEEKNNEINKVEQPNHHPSASSIEKQLDQADKSPTVKK